MVNVHIRASVRFFSVALLAAACSFSFAATDGTKGANSTGSANINANVPAKVKISGMTDLDFDTALSSWSSGDLTETTTACVWSSTGGYTVKAASATPADTAFVLKASGQSDLPYSVTWTDSAATSTALSYDTATTATQVTDAGNQNCATGVLAQLSIKLAGADLEAAKAADYSGVINVTVATP